jgi:hypothetical protein
MLRAHSIWALILLLSSSPLLASKPVEKVVTADTPDKFETVVEKVRSQMAPGERYEFLKEKDRNKVNQKLDRMAGMLAKAGSVEAMPPEEQARLFSLQEEINGILARNADDRLVCSHDAPTGSHLPSTTCHTVRELKRNREDSRRWSDRLRDQNRLGPGRDPAGG